MLDCIYIYIYIYVCVCVCVHCMRSSSKNYLVYWSSRHIYSINSGGVKLECIYVYICISLEVAVKLIWCTAF